MTRTQTMPRVYKGNSTKWHHDICIKFDSPKMIQNGSFNDPCSMQWLHFFHLFPLFLGWSRQPHLRQRLQASFQHPRTCLGSPTQMGFIQTLMLQGTPWWVGRGPLTVKSDHQEYHIFRIGDPYKPERMPLLLGGGHPQMMSGLKASQKK